MKRLVVTEHTRIERRAGDAPPGPGDVAFLRPPVRPRSCVRPSDREDQDLILEWSGRLCPDQAVGRRGPGAWGADSDLAEGRPARGQPDAATLTEARHQTRRNLLYMLSVSGDVPVRNRDIARLAVRQAPLSETLAAIFADCLRRKLLLGPERAYQGQEANLRSFKGKLLIARQVQHNAAHRERFYCRYDEFSEDTVMNRVFRASCRALRGDAHAGDPGRPPAPVCSCSMESPTWWSRRRTSTASRSTGNASGSRTSCASAASCSRAVRPPSRPAERAPSPSCST